MKKFFLAVLMIIITSGICTAVEGSLRVVETTDTTATIKFTNILGAEEGKFQIYYAMSSISAGTGEPNRIMDKNSNAFTYEGDTVTYQLTGLSPQTVYTFRIEAENADGKVVLDNPMEATFTTKIHLDNPIRSSESTWKLSWGNISLNPTESENSIVVYHVYRKNPETDSFEIVGGGATNNLYIKLSVEEIIFQVKAAVDMDGDGDTDINFESVPKEWKVEETIVPSVPGMVDKLGEESEEVGNDYIKILWENQQLDDVVYDIYLIENKADLDNRNIKPTVENFIPSESDSVYDRGELVGYRYRFDNLEDNKMYYVKIVAKKGYEISEPSIKTCTTKAVIEDVKPLVVGAPPFTLVTDEETGRALVGDTWATVKWQNTWIEKWNSEEDMWEYDATATEEMIDAVSYRKVQYEDDIKFAIGYEVYTSDFDMTKINEIEPKIYDLTAKESTEYVVQGLTTETNYIMWIRAYREVDNRKILSDASKTIVFSTYNEPKEPIVAPTIPVISSITTTDETMAITANFEDDKTYNIYYGTEESFEKAKNILKVTSKDLDKERKYTIKKLTPSTTYYIWIQAEIKINNQVLNSAMSDSHKAVTKDIEQPDSPKAFGTKEELTTINSITFEWIYEDTVTYELEISKTKDFAEKKTYSSIANSIYEVTELEPNTRYYARLYAISKSKKAYSEPTAKIQVRTAKEEGDYTDGREEKEKEILPVVIKPTIKKSVVTVDLTDIDNDVFIAGLNKSTSNRYEIKYNAKSKDEYEFIIGSELLKLLNGSKKELVFGNNEFEVALRKGMYELDEKENLVIRVEEKTATGYQYLSSNKKIYGNNYDIEILLEKSGIYNKAKSKTGLIFRVLYDEYKDIDRDIGHIGKYEASNKRWRELDSQVHYDSFGSGVVEAYINESGVYAAITEV